MKDIMAEIRSDRPTISFEVFPPKKEAVFESVQQKADHIASLCPSFMSVTYGAGGGTSKFTIDIAEGIQKKYDVPAMAHLTCVSTPREKIEGYVAEMQNRGLTHIMALRGDIPAEAPDKSEWGFAHASDLISYVKEAAPEMTIGAACYPECHPESSHVSEDIANLKKKCDAGTDFLTSQMFFDNNVFFTFLFKAREAGISVPILPGIMPITNAKQVIRARDLSHAFMPRRFTAIVDRFGDDPDAMRKAGIAYATDQIIDLYANGINHVHVYAMNDYGVASAIMENLKGIIV